MVKTIIMYTKHLCYRHHSRPHHQHHLHPQQRLPPQMSLDRLELSVDGGRVKIFLQIGHYDKTLIIGQVLVISSYDRGNHNDVECWC